MLFLASWEPENFSNCIGNAARRPTRRLKRKDLNMMYAQLLRGTCVSHLFFSGFSGPSAWRCGHFVPRFTFSIRLPPFNPTVGVTSKSNGGASLSGILLVSTLLDVHTSIFYIWVYSNAHVVKRRRFQENVNRCRKASLLYIIRYRNHVGL